MAEGERKAAKVVVGVILIALLVYMFVALQTKPQVQEEPQPKTAVEEALLKGGVPFDRVLVSNGSEVGKAFGLNRTAIPEGLEVAVVIMKEPFAEKDLGTYWKAMYSALDADPELGGVLLFVAIEGQDAFLIYSDRSLAEELKPLNLPPAELFNRWYVLKFTMER